MKTAIGSAEVLNEAARECTEREAQTVAPKLAVRRLVLALTATAPVAVWVIWMLAAH